MKLRIKKDAIRDYMVSQSGYTITKEEYTEVNPDAVGIKYLTKRPDVEVIYNEDEALEKLNVEEQKEVKKEVIKDSYSKETIKATIPKNTIKDVVVKEDKE